MGQILERIPVVNWINQRQAIPDVRNNRISQRSKFVSARMLRLSKTNPQFFFYIWPLETFNQMLSATYITVCECNEIQKFITPVVRPLLSYTLL